MKKLESKTVKELISMARKWGVSGYSKLKKAELVKLLASKLPGGKRSEASKAKPSNPVQPKAQAPKATAGSRSTSTRSRAGQSAQDQGRRATQAGRAARAKASKARLAGRGRQDYAPPGIEPAEEPAASVAPPQGELGLPARYGDGRMGLLPRDPHWLYCFWDLTAEQSARIQAAPQTALRVILVGDPADRQVQLISMPAGASSWYVHVDDSDRTYRCDLVGQDAGGGWETILSSNPSSTPPDGATALPSQVSFAPTPGSAQQRPAPAPATVVSRPADREQASKLQRMSLDEGPAGGLDSASAQAPRPQPGAAGGPASEDLHSAGLAAGAAAPSASEAASEKGFWLQMDADLILYGATVPGASVTLAGIPLSLDAQGHFRARFALPDGGHGFELLATSPDGSDRRRIQVEVDRRTAGPSDAG